MADQSFTETSVPVESPLQGAGDECQLLILAPSLHSAKRGGSPNDHLFWAGEES